MFDVAAFRAMFTEFGSTSPTSGYLSTEELSEAEQQTLQAVPDASFTVTVDGGIQQDITALDLTGAADMPALAVLLDGQIAGASVAWDESFNKFIFTSSTTGSSSSVSFLGTEGTGTDISTLLKAASALGAIQVDGESASSDYPDSLVQVWGDQALSEMDEDRFGDQYTIASYYLTAHFVVRQQMRAREAAKGAIPGQKVGIQTSKSVGSVSGSFDTGMTSRDGWGDLNTTVYGREFIRYANLAGMVGFAV